VICLDTGDEESNPGLLPIIIAISGTLIFILLLLLTIVIISKRRREKSPTKMFEMEEADLHFAEP